MPTYFATGVTATLVSCDLQSSLTNVFDSRQGSQQRADAKRVNNVFSLAKNLPERPIGEDGSDTGVVQFIGVNVDQPLYMVVAGDNVTIKPRAVDKLSQTQTKKGQDPLSNLPIFSDDSTLTSLGATPTSIQRNVNCSPQKGNATPPQVETESPLTRGPTLEHVLQSTRSVLDPYKPQALVLKLQISPKTFLPLEESKGRSRQQTRGKDLKIEVFVNGCLMDLSFIPSRRAGPQFVYEKLHFSGMRVHRQVEKPMVYVPSDTDKFTEHGKEAGRRWDSVASTLVHEAEIRGKDHLGSLPPSAEFLLALAGLEIPERLTECHCIGIIDVVITGGKGKKHGPETSYIMKPTRLHDPDYTAVNDDNEFFSLDSALPNFAPELDSPLAPLYFPNILSQSSPDIPLRQCQRKANMLTQSPTPKKTIDLASNLGLDVDLKKTFANYETARGKVGKAGRTLGQRLGDLKKMSKGNMEREFDILKDEFGVQKPLSKKMEQEMSIELERGFIYKSPILYTDPDPTIDPSKLLGNPSAPPEGADPQAMLTQSRIEIALNEGAVSNGPLLRHIFATSPERTPKKQTRASALAHSPTHVPVKPQRRAPKKDIEPVTPQKRRKMTDGSPLCHKETMDQTMTPTKQMGVGPSPGANRSAQKWNPTEQTVSEAVEGFKVPETCVGSTVSFADDAKVQRQIGKARGGAFNEEVLVVGMRFIVI